eukprot:COSAG01_NODE_321_length_18903_cov_13.082429_13_plen_93_part_00
MCSSHSLEQFNDLCMGKHCGLSSTNCCGQATKVAIGLLGDVRKTYLLSASRGCSGVVCAPAGLTRLAHPFAAWANTRMKWPGRRGGHSLGKC